MVNAQSVRGWSTRSGVVVFGGLPAVGDVVGRVAGQLGEHLVPESGVADFVLRQAGEGNVLLEHGRDAGPLGVAEAEHELVVGHRVEQLDDRVAGLQLKAADVEARDVGNDQLPRR